MHKLKLLLLASLFTIPMGLSAHTLDLKLLGSRTVKIAGMFKLADIQLYSDSKPNTPLLTSDQPIQLRIQYHRKLSADHLIKIANDALAEEHNEVINKKFQPLVRAINQSYVDVEKGDTYELLYHPSKGLTLSLNERELAHLNNAPFAQYYLKIWLGTNRIAAKTNPLLGNN